MMTRATPKGSEAFSAECLLGAREAPRVAVAPAVHVCVARRLVCTGRFWRTLLGRTPVPRWECRSRWRRCKRETYLASALLPRLRHGTVFTYVHTESGRSICAPFRFSFFIFSFSTCAPRARVRCFVWSIQFVFTVCRNFQFRNLRNDRFLPTTPLDFQLFRKKKIDFQREFQSKVIDQRGESLTQ